MNKLLAALRKAALGHPGATEGVACEGTAIEKRTVKAGGKAFLFLGPRDAMLKLGASLPEAVRLTAEQPTRYKAGAGGWVKIQLGPEDPPRVELLVKWVAESYELLGASRAGKSVAKAASARKAGAGKGRPK
jgi:hypothetical protein